MPTPRETSAWLRQRGTQFKWQDGRGVIRRLRTFPNCQLFLSELGIEHVINAIAEQIDAQHEQ